MSVKLSVFGVRDLLQDLQDMGQNVDAAAAEALQGTADRVTADLKAGIARHHRTGHTEEQLRTNPTVESAGGKHSVKVGFKLPEGLPARYINKGTPTNKPKDAFVDRALNKTKIRKEQEAALRKIINGG